MPRCAQKLFVGFGSKPEGSFPTAKAQNLPVRFRPDPESEIISDPGGKPPVRYAAGIVLTCQSHVQVVLIRRHFAK